MSDESKQEKKEKKQKNLTRRSFGRNVAGSVVCAGACVAAAVASDQYSAFLDHYLGAGEATITSVEGSEDWDTNYYTQEYDTVDDATAAAEDLLVDLACEGIVLLKNDNDALPLDPATETISLLGRFAVDCVYGGTGSGQVDTSTATNLYQGIADAGFTMNDTTYDFIEENYEDYEAAYIGLMGTSNYYIGEIPWEDYSTEAQESIAGTVGVVVLGRAGGEGDDLSNNLIEDLDLDTDTDDSTAAYVATSGSIHQAADSEDSTLTTTTTDDTTTTDGSTNAESDEDFDPSDIPEGGGSMGLVFSENEETDNYVEGQHELELCVEEKSVLEAAIANCDKVIVIVNASTSMELGPIMSGGDYEVDAILEVGSYGATGAAAVGKVLSGEVNPSGRTCDIWAADFTADPTFGNFGGCQYEDITDHYGSGAYFTEYKEGIYFGYRYYETAAVEAEAGNYDGFDYDSAVVFPFGYGLSYTTFDETLDSVDVADDTVTCTVTVTNSGSVAGKDVVEIYYSAPYTYGGIEKSAVVLGAFAKTSELEAGASETLELSFPVRQMASWSMDLGYYVLDEGDYVISLRSDSHNVIAEETLTFSETEYTTDEATGTELTNQFSDMTEYMEANCENLSRADFAGTWPSDAENRNAADCGITLEEYVTEDHLDDSDEMPTTGADNGLSLIDLRGLDYDDETWDLLLDELSVDDMTTMFSDCAYNTPAIDSINKPATVEPDGPAGFTSLATTAMGASAGGNCAYCSEYLLAQTWNVDALYDMGLMIGQEALVSGYNGWYAPGMNTHRSPFAGRNFEYYSEDPLLAGKLAAAVVSGAATNGVYAMCKHFAMNDQEHYRAEHLCMWANEQTVREIYLKPFEIAVKEATYEEKYISDTDGTVSTRTAPACTGIMSSYNYVGATWSGGRKSLCTNVLRDEWGFTGCVISDFNAGDYMVYSQAIEAGTDLQLGYASMKDRTFEDTDHATVVNELRTSSHRLLYTVANSNAMQGMASGSIVTYSTAAWQYLVWGIEAALVVGAVYFGYRAYTAKKAKKELAAAGESSAAETTAVATDADQAVTSDGNSTEA